MSIRYKGGLTHGTVKCPHCGSGRTYEQVLPDPQEIWLLRYTCLECWYTWADQAGRWPAERRR